MQCMRFKNAAQQSGSSQLREGISVVNLICCIVRYEEFHMSYNAKLTYGIRSTIIPVVLRLRRYIFVPPFCKNPLKFLECGSAQNGKDDMLKRASKPRRSI